MSLARLCHAHLRRRLLMQSSLAQKATVNAAAGSSASSSLKRPYAHAAPADESAPKHRRTSAPKDSDSKKHMPPSNSHYDRSFGGYNARHRRGGGGGGGGGGGRRGQRGPQQNIQSWPVYNREYIEKHHKTRDLPPKYYDNPKSHLGNRFKNLRYETIEWVPADSPNTKLFRSRVALPTEHEIVGVGDAPTKLESHNNAALCAAYQADGLGELFVEDITQITLSDGSVVDVEKARSFIDYYCRRYNFEKPEIVEEQGTKGGMVCWDAMMLINGSKVGIGHGTNRKAATIACYLDVTAYLEKCDPELWKTYVQAAKTGADLGLAPKVYFTMSNALDNDLRDLCYDIKKSNLYRNRPSVAAVTAPAAPPAWSASRTASDATIQSKSKLLSERRQAYLENPKLDKMRKTRAALPVYTKAEDLIKHIEENDVTICMAATGSGKTTQIPQLILDHHIDKGEGGRCNIICTQPRRLAAISVADRVAKERGETVGQSVGYTVRFESRAPEPNGSITFCTIGVFLKKLQSGLVGNSAGSEWLDTVQYIIVDEVHERDVDTDLMLVVLKRILADRRARGKPMKVILMSATIDPTLFQTYLPDQTGQPAKVIEIPGRSFPVQQTFIDEFGPKLASDPRLRWVFQDDQVQKFLVHEFGPDRARAMFSVSLNKPSNIKEDDLDVPIPVVCAMIQHVLEKSDDGHVLVFLPGWDEIQSVTRMLTNPRNGSWRLPFSNSSKYTIHALHSSVPLAEQQVIFEPPPEGVRRIILSTNIAETSVTIPDVVYVVDSGRHRENRYDPDRHMSRLVNAWVGLSNLNQRAGRAGRHRPGEYYGILSEAHKSRLATHQTVEMKRVDLSNVVMHIKALHFPDMTTEEVLERTIEPPPADRVAAAMDDLRLVGALDEKKDLTALGRVLLQIPCDVQIGRLLLYGSFFRCLDQALTLAAIMSNRDPFVAPMHLKEEARQAKDSWADREFRSDVLAALKAYNAWWDIQKNGEYVRANRFCVDNFLSKPTLVQMQKEKTHLYDSMRRAGVLDVSAGGSASFTRHGDVPSELNVNGGSMPLLTALITLACQPKYALRIKDKIYRTAMEKNVLMHPSSVNDRKRLTDHETHERMLYAFIEKRMGTGGNQMSIVNTTRIDLLTYILFGASKTELTPRGLECDGWLPIVGNLDALEDTQRLKELFMGCMLRVYQGILMRRRVNRKLIAKQEAARHYDDIDRESDDDDEDEDADKNYALTPLEVQELDLLTRDVVRLLNDFAGERIGVQSVPNSVPGTPAMSPRSFGGRRPLPGETRSGYATPNSFSRPSTPSRLSRRLF
ncbi:hypothetical protein EV715DRAFT_251413 [Schizophyllum commune]